jgi:hypothetical protein
VPAIELHSIQNRLGLEAGCFKRGSRDMTALSKLRNAENGTLGVINPVWGEQT